MKILSNPITVKELRSRMRGLRAILPMMAYLVILGIFVLTQFAQFGATVNYSDLNKYGEEIGFTLMYGQLILVLILAPAYASSAITVEKERETFEVMLTTLLSSWEIVAGKVFSGFSYAALLLVSSLPLLALAFWMGGFEPLQLFWGFFVIISCALLTTCMGIMLSTLFGRSYMSTGVTYGIVLGGIGVSYAFIALIQAAIINPNAGSSWFSWHLLPVWLAYSLNPVMIMESLKYGATNIASTGLVHNNLIYYIEKFFNDMGLPYLVVYIIISLGLSAFMLYLASIFLFKSSRKDS